MADLKQSIKPKKKGKKKKKATASLSSLSISDSQGESKVDALLEQAESLVVGFQAAEAIPILRQVLELAPKETAAWDLLAQAFIAEEKTDEAVQALKRSIALAPAENHTKWMTLGQLSEGRYALKALQQGCKVAQEQRAKLQSVFADGTAEDQKEFKIAIDDLGLELSRGYTAMGELYTTDLCDEPEAESECTRLLELAIQTCPINPEAHAAVASLRLIQKRPAEALAATKRSLQTLQQAEASGGSVDLSLDGKLNIAKLCFEQEIFDDAASLFEKLLEEDDRCVEVWYLSGVCYAKLGKPNTALKYLARSLEMLRQVPDPDPELKEKAFVALQQARKAVQDGAAEDSDNENEMNATGTGDRDSDDDEEMMDAETAYGSSTT